MTGKTIAIVAVAAVGAVVLVKMLAPAPATAARKAGLPTDLVSLQGLVSIGSGLAGLFGGGSSSGGSGSGNGGAYADAASQAVLKQFDSGNYSVSDNFMYTDASGNFIAG